MTEADPELEWMLLELRERLGDALWRARDEGAVRPTLYVARPAAFLGLAFVRELLGAGAAPGTSSEVIVGCASRNVVACALLCIDAAFCRRVLDLDARGWEVPVVVLDQRARVVTIDVSSVPRPRRDEQGPPTRRRAALRR